MTKQQVRDLIGEPDYGTLTGPKNLLGGASGSAWSYYFFTTSYGNSFTDELVEVFFDRYDRVEAILPVRIEGLSPIGFSDEQLKDLEHLGAL